MKRFTETDKWRDSWFQALSPDAKLVFIYIAENCDAAGVWDPNERLAEFSIGKKIKWLDVYEELQSKIVRLGNGKIFMIRFIEFQYGILTEACKPHLKVFRTLHIHGITYPIDTLSLPYTKGKLTLEDKDKEEDKDRDRGVGEETAAPGSASRQFVKPTADQVTEYSQEIGYPIDGAAWCDVYAQKGWSVGKTTMKDWKAAVRNWKSNGYAVGARKSGQTVLAPEYNKF